MANALLEAPGPHSGSRPPEARPPVRLVVLAVVMLTSLAWATIAAADGATASVFGPALALALVAGLAGGLSSRRTSSRWAKRPPPAPVGDILDLPTLEVPQFPADQFPADQFPADQLPEATSPVDLREGVAVRTLRAQVHALEEALEQVQGALAARQEEALALEGHRRAVLLTVQAIADRTAGAEGARSALSRVAAAVERLGAPDSFARPVLPPPEYVAVHAPAAPVLVAVPVVEPALAAPQPPSQPQPAVLETPETPETADLPEIAEAHHEPVTASVLPVPPRPVAPASHGRGWRRNRAS